MPERKTPEQSFMSGYAFGYLDIGKEGVTPALSDMEDAALDEEENMRHDDPDTTTSFYHWMQGVAEGIEQARSVRRSNEDNLYRGG